MNRAKIRCLVSVAGGMTFALATSVANAAFTDVTGVDGGGWRVVYQKHIGTSGSLQTAGYDTNNTTATFGGVAGTGTVLTGSYNRVAYYLELSGSAASGDTNGSVFVSFDASGVSADPTKIGIPTTTSGEFYQRGVNHMHVIASTIAGGNVGGVVNQTDSSGGNIEFWPSNYAQTNSANVPLAGGSTSNNADFDWGDGGANTTAGYGSMQIHNHSIGTTPTDTAQTILNFNNWGGGSGNYNVGIGNYSLAGASFGKDWTFSHTAANYTIRDLQILVNVPEPASLGLLSLGAFGVLARRRRG